MTYFKIKKAADQRKRIDGSIYVANELYTLKEKEKYNIPVAYYDTVEIPKSKIYFMFGARFAMEK